METHFLKFCLLSWALGFVELDCSYKNAFLVTLEMSAVFGLNFK